MKLKLLIFAGLVAAAATGGWYVGRYGSAIEPRPGNHERKILFYQSPMHPWIKSDKPGNCTICGMKLAPVYEGDTPLDVETSSAVRLSASSVTVLNVQTAEVRQRPLHRVVRVAGTIEDDDTRHRRLSAYVEGRIEKLGVRYIGAEVRQGDLLAQIYSPALLSARDEYILLSRQPGSPQRDRLLSAAGEKLVRLGLAPEQIRKLPELKDPSNFIDILAPMSGTVVTRNVYEGQYVKEGEVLFEIADFSKMWFVFNAYEQDLGWIQPGQLVEVSSPLIPGKRFKAPIDFMDPNLDATTRSAKVRVILENPFVGEGPDRRRELLRKVYADGVIEIDTQPVISVPRSAVLASGNQPIAYVVQGEGSYEPRVLRLGRAGDDVWEVLDGLSEGERVVTTGNLLIDAQAQLDHGGSENAQSPNPTDALAKTRLPDPFQSPLTGQQLESANSLFAISNELVWALAADDLKRFNMTVARIQPLTGPLTTAFGQLATPIVSAVPIDRADDLTAARKSFYGFSKAVAEFALQLRAHDGKAFGTIRVFECPMVKDAVPSAVEKKGRWVQVSGDLRNPYFGAEMPECGVEVKP